MTIQTNSPLGTMQIDAVNNMRLRSRTVLLPDGRRLRIRLEASFWEGIDEILDREGLRLPELIVMMERMAGASSDGPMVPRLRHLVIQYFHEAATRTRGTDARTDSAEVIPFETFRRRRGKN